MTYERLLDGSAAFKEESTGTALESDEMKVTFRKLYDYHLIPVSRLFADKAAKFIMLKVEWEAQTAYLSSINDISMHPAYQKIIGMGDAAVSLILAELRRKPGHWFWALKSITGEDPVLPAQRGRMRQMTEAWLNWGREKGYLFE